MNVRENILDFHIWDFFIFFTRSLIYVLNVVYEWISSCTTSVVIGVKRINILSHLSMFDALTFNHSSYAWQYTVISLLPSDLINKNWTKTIGNIKLKLNYHLLYNPYECIGRHATEILQLHVAFPSLGNMVKGVVNTQMNHGRSNPFSFRVSFTNTNIEENVMLNFNSRTNFRKKKYESDHKHHAISVYLFHSTVVKGECQILFHSIRENLTNSFLFQLMF